MPVSWERHSASRLLRSASLTSRPRGDTEIECRKRGARHTPCAFVLHRALRPSAQVGAGGIGWVEVSEVEADLFLRPFFRRLPLQDL